MSFQQRCQPHYRTAAPASGSPQHVPGRVQEREGNNSCSLTFNACAKKRSRSQSRNGLAPRFWKWCFRQCPNRHAHNAPTTWPASSPCRNGFCARQDRQYFEEQICHDFALTVCERRLVFLPISEGTGLGMGLIICRESTGL